MPIGEAEKLAPRTSSSTPTAPSSMPANSKRVGRLPASNPKAHTTIGTVAINVAIKPEPMYRCALASQPIAPANIKQREASGNAPS